MSVDHARAVVTRDSASFHEQVRAVGTLAAADDEATVADLLMCLRCRDVPARLAACALYRRTGRTPVPEQPLEYIIDLDDWAAYVADRPALLTRDAPVTSAPVTPAPVISVPADPEPARPAPAAPPASAAPSSAVLTLERPSEHAPVVTSTSTPASDSAHALPASRGLSAWPWRRSAVIALGIAAIGVGCAALALQWPFAVTVTLGATGNVLLAGALLTSRRDPSTAGG